LKSLLFIAFQIPVLEIPPPDPPPLFFHRNIFTGQAFESTCRAFILHEATCIGTLNHSPPHFKFRVFWSFPSMNRGPLLSLRDTLLGSSLSVFSSVPLFFSLQSLFLLPFVFGQNLSLRCFLFGFYSVTCLSLLFSLLDYASSLSLGALLNHAHSTFYFKRVPEYICLTFTHIFFPFCGGDRLFFSPPVLLLNPFVKSLQLTPFIFSHDA